MRKRKGNSVVGVGIIGLGWGRWHLEHYQSLKDVRVMAICDANPKRLAETAEKYNIKKCYRDATDLLRDPEVDAVSIVIPNYLHARMVQLALKAGKHVLCEKPLADTVKHAELIVKAARKSKQTVMLGMPRRFSPETHYIHGLLEQDKLGEAYYGYTHFLRAFGGIPGLGVGRNGREWFKIKKMSGGGALIDIGVHVLDVLWYLMGCPRPVAALGKTYAKFGPKLCGKDHFDVEDLGCGLITFTNDASIYLDAAWSVARAEGVSHLSVFGTEGSAAMGPFSVTRLRRGKPVNETPDLSRKRYFNQFEHFIDCVRTGRKSISPVQQGLTVVKMLDAIYRSNASGRTVQIR